MPLTGIDAVVFGVEDLTAARRFLIDWGLRDDGGDDHNARYLTRDGTEVIAREKDDPCLPPPIQTGPTLREVVWGVEEPADLQRLAAALGIPLAVGADAPLRLVDPDGLSHAFRVTRRVPVLADPQDVNGPGVVRRVDTRATIYDRARPISVGHVVLFVDNLQASLDFFVHRLGFVVSDSYPGHAAFLRARTPGSHHDLFVLARPGNPGLNHVAFTVSNIHEVFGGGMAMMRHGWETDLGPGRHPISSAYFWYMRSPFGGSFEYYADDDYCTEAWEAREFERKPELFAEWAISGGIDGNTRRQVRAA
ncbi:MAG: glyoxalase [Rhizorhabdus sp.]|jgi:catechol 2,3-dioxygenase-like lactoylglutathione lyase family enzyme|nr:MAG: glyoxalase [Rhizorhabdus sp.]